MNGFWNKIWYVMLFTVPPIFGALAVFNVSENDHWLAVYDVVILFAYGILAGITIGRNEFHKFLRELYELREDEQPAIDPKLSKNKKGLVEL